MNYKILLSGVMAIFLVAGGLYFIIPSQIEQRALTNDEMLNQDEYTFERQVDLYDFDDTDEEYPDLDEEDEYFETEYEEEVIDDSYTLPSGNAASVTLDPIVETPQPDPTPVIIPNPTPVPEPEPATPGYTLSEVSKHNDDTSCWTAIDGDVYDLTTYMKKHPGGKSNILKICGIDGTNAFEKMHGGESRPERVLGDYYIGILN